MNTEFMTRRHQPAALSAPAGGHAGAAGEQHRQGYVCPSAGGDLYGGDGGHQRNFICSISHCGTGGGAGAQRADLQANLAGIGGRRIAPTGAPGDWSAEPDLCPHSKKLNR